MISKHSYLFGGSSHFSSEVTPYRFSPEGLFFVIRLGQGNALPFSGNPFHKSGIKLPSPHR
jgi:hypothetical protein